MVTPAGMLGAIVLGGGSVVAEACTILNCVPDMVGLEAGEAVR